MNKFNSAIKYERYSISNLLSVIYQRRQTFRTLMQHFGYVPAMHNALKRLEKEGKIKIIEVFQGKNTMFFVKYDYAEKKIKSKERMVSDKVSMSIIRRKKIMKGETI